MLPGYVSFFIKSFQQFVDIWVFFSNLLIVNGNGNGSKADFFKTLPENVIVFICGFIKFISIMK